MVTDSNAPANDARYILLCTLGTTTAVVVETLIGLMQGQLKSGKWPALRFPDEIHLLVTYDPRAGGPIGEWRKLIDSIAECAKAWGVQGVAQRTVVFRGLRNDQPAAPIAWPELLIANAQVGAPRPGVYRDWSNKQPPLADIRTSDDNIAAAGYIAALVEELTRDNERTVLHASIAGGRKTMSADLQTAMTLFMRAGDAVSHVLVGEQLDGQRAFTELRKWEFLVPARQDSLQKTLKTTVPALELAENLVLPVGRMINQQSLRDMVRFDSDGKHVPFKRIVELLEIELTHPEFVVDWNAGTATFCGRNIRLSRRAYCLLSVVTWWYQSRPSQPFPVGRPRVVPASNKAYWAISAKSALDALIRYLWALKFCAFEQVGQDKSVERATTALFLGAEKYKKRRESGFLTRARDKSVPVFVLNEMVTPSGESWQEISKLWRSCMTKVGLVGELEEVPLCRSTIPLRFPSTGTGQGGTVDHESAESSDAEEDSETDISQEGPPPYGWRLHHVSADLPDGISFRFEQDETAAEFEEAATNAELFLSRLSSGKEGVNQDDLVALYLK